MAWFKCMGGSGGGGSTILKGTTTPTSVQGENGQIYLKYGLPQGALLHFEDTATTDEFENSWTTDGTAALSDSQHKFGSKSLYLDGTSMIQTSTVNSNFNFKSNDFTISCWIYPTSSSRQAVFSMSVDCRLSCDILFRNGSANMWLSSNGGSWNIIQSDNTGDNDGAGTIAINTNEWTHIAYTRKGNVCRMFVNGQVAKTVTITDGTSIYWSGSDFFRIGKWGGGGMPFTGYIDEFLVLNGICLYPEAFTPPTEPYDIDDLSETILNTYGKVDGVWRDLVGININDITT